MAQQTQIARVVEAWSRFLERFPTVAALASASPADVLREWRGMGYDRRALNLHRAARVIVAEHGGQVPRDLAALQRLPGIGPYTARAVAALAFGAAVGAVDTNVRRVLGRALGAEGGLAPAELQAAADASVDPARPGAWTHAVMDIGATVCRPARPDCEACPLRPWCRFAAASLTGPPRPRPRRPRDGAAQPFHSTTAGSAAGSSTGCGRPRPRLDRGLRPDRGPRRGRRRAGAGGPRPGRDRGAGSARSAPGPSRERLSRPG